MVVIVRWPHQVPYTKPCELNAVCTSEYMTMMVIVVSAYSEGDMTNVSQVIMPCTGSNVLKM